MSVSRVTTGNFIKASDINQIIPLIVLKSTSATISSTGGKQIYICSPANATTITLTLPTLSANKTRELIFVHGTTNTGKVKVKGDSSHKIEGSSYIYLNSKSDNLSVFGATNEWKRIGSSRAISYTLPSTISVNSVKGLSSAGLKLKGSTGALGIFVAKTGKVGMGTTTITGLLEVGSSKFRVTTGGSIYAKSGREVAGTFDSDYETDQNTIFDALSPYFSVVGKTYRISGAVALDGGNTLIVDSAYRLSTKIVLNGITAAGAYAPTDINNGSTGHINAVRLSW